MSHPEGSQRGTNMTLIRPRLTDHFGILRSQADLDFAIPFLDEDIPLYVDPFMLCGVAPVTQDTRTPLG